MARKAWRCAAVPVLVALVLALPAIAAVDGRLTIRGRDRELPEPATEAIN